MVELWRQVVDTDGVDLVEQSVCIPHAPVYSGTNHLLPIAASELHLADRPLGCSEDHFCARRRLHLLAGSC